MALSCAASGRYARQRSLFFREHPQGIGRRLRSIIPILLSVTVDILPDYRAWIVNPRCGRAAGEPVCLPERGEYDNRRKRGEKGVCSSPTLVVCPQKGQIGEKYEKRRKRN
ncbi:hypothetical protein DXC51_21855 [Eisenbergiella massiliensis]|uniref:Uncharacterized protein n=1 Tax=Eisenbergiella massiliensis TaxID=1720294 RepID=A0A3E3HYA4_9FIRM|nr:hypothetical protein DXC51_21855 [Eisenbergiella massiliensis]